MSWSTPRAVSAGDASGPPGLAATATTGHPAKRVLSKVLRIFLVICNSNYHSVRSLHGYIVEQTQRAESY